MNGFRRAAVVALFTLGAGGAGADEPAPPPPGISDNSFLLEEAYNQERGVVQHISGFSRFGGSDWIYTFTQEWPVPAQRHQLSATVPVQATELGTGVGDVALNYRYQLLQRARVAVAPRLSVLVPSGSSAKGLGAGGLGLQASLPVSVSLGSRLVAHSNLGVTWVPRARDEVGDAARTVAWNAGQSAVWLARPAFNVLLEVAWTRAQQVTGAGRTVPAESLFASPGVRWAYNFASGLQIVPGLAVPIGVGASRGRHGVFLYLSFEHPFRKTQGQ